jgi:putative addiction module component (TIGR02574 family)
MVGWRAQRSCHQESVIALDMVNIPKKIEVEALELPVKARAELARILLLSLDEHDEHMDEDIEQVWAEEAERRYEEIRAGKVSTIPSEQVFQEVRSRRR